MKNEELCFMPATEMAAAIKQKKISPVEVIDAILNRIDKINPKINAYVTLTAEAARSAAKAAEDAVMKGKALGPLHGVPVSIKDLVFTKGIRTTFGSKLYEHFIPDEDCAFVEKLKAAGAIILGKTNTPEFGLIANTDNPVFGPTRNPWNLTKTPGGSSGGAAAAAAAALGPLHHGNDGGGSIRIPSSFCGVYGLKPQFGRVARQPALHGFETLAAEGSLTRTVADGALMLSVMAGPDERDHFSLPTQEMNLIKAVKGGVKGCKAAWSPNLGYAVVDPEVRDITRKAARQFEHLGCKVEEITADFLNMGSDWLTLVICETAAAVEQRREEWEKVMYSVYKPFIPMADTFTSRDMAMAQFHREDLWAKIHQIFEKYDFLLTPTMPITAFDVETPLGPTKIDGQDVSPTAVPCFTLPFNFTGQPAATVPCGFTKEGLPVGLQIVGRRYDEATVIRASAAFEKACPWADKKPPLT
jgi:aspartyl-tRNA(Asn)/glutamyl-tRNA(Gln) amidotransferase subunit A